MENAVYNPLPLTHAEKLLMHEVEACEDPVCCCEPEPRWLAFQNEIDCPAGLCEWENLRRAPAEEL